MTDENGDDLFDQFDSSVDGREGDPFEQLEDDSEGVVSSDETRNGEDDSELDGESLFGTKRSSGEDIEGDDTEQAESPAVETGDGFNFGPTTGNGHEDSAVETEEGNPFADAGTRESDPFESSESAFERMEVTELDPDEVWDSLSEAEDRGSVSDFAERTFSEVSKHSYCEQCEFFSEPPKVSCTHDGTELLEFVDVDTVRVVDCPVVAEREELEKHE